MKWRTPEAPKEGDTRTQHKFAWLPTETVCDDGEFTVWLENYAVEEVYEAQDVHFVDAGTKELVCTGRELGWRTVRRFPLFLTHGS